MSLTSVDNAKATETLGVAAPPSQNENLQNDPALLSYYGLKTDPFVKNDSFFHCTSALKKLLKLMDHLLLYGNKLMVLTGPTGIGKSLVLENFVARHEDFMIRTIQAIESDTSAQLFREIIADNRRSAAEELDVETTAQRIIRVGRSGQQLLLVIDDAHQLSPQVFHQLYQLWCRSNQEEELLHLLLCGEPQLQMRANQIVDANERTLFHQLLLPFNADEVRDYVNARFEAQGDGDKVPFSDEDYEALYEASQGVPADIDAAASQRLQVGVERLLASEPKESRSMVGIALAAIMTLALGLGILYWSGYFSGGDFGVASGPTLVREQAAQPVVRAIERSPVAEVIAPTQEDHSQQGSTHQDGASRPEQILAEQATAPLIEAERVEEIEESSDIVSVDELPEPASQPVESADSTNPLNNDLVVAEGEVFAESEIATTQAPEPTVAASSLDGPIQDVPVQASGTEQSGIAQILSKPAQHYTMQLMGSHTEARLAKFIDRVPLDNYTYFLTQHKGEPWFVLTYGDYENRAAAQADLQQLPEAIQKLKPWIRSFSGIQKALR